MIPLLKGSRCFIATRLSLHESIEVFAKTPLVNKEQTECGLKRDRLSVALFFPLKDL